MYMPFLFKCSASKKSGSTTATFISKPLPRISSGSSFTKKHNCSLLQHPSYNVETQVTNVWCKRNDYLFTKDETSTKPRNKSPFCDIRVASPSLNGRRMYKDMPNKVTGQGQEQHTSPIYLVLGVVTVNFDRNDFWFNILVAVDVGNGIWL